MIPIVLSNIQRQFDEIGIQGLVCRQRIICQSSADRNNTNNNSFGGALGNFFR